MTLKNTLESKISYRIKRSRTPVFIRQDFQDIGGYDQVGRILRNLVKKKVLINMGYGSYIRSKKSNITGNIIPEKPLPEIAVDLLQKLKVKTFPTKSEKAYNAGKSTQVPTGRVIGVKKRISRQIGYNGAYISFEKVS